LHDCLGILQTEISLEKSAKLTNRNCPFCLELLIFLPGCRCCTQRSLGELTKNTGFMEIFLKRRTQHHHYGNLIKNVYPFSHFRP